MTLIPTAVNPTQTSFCAELPVISAVSGMLEPVAVEDDIENGKDLPVFSAVGHRAIASLSQSDVDLKEVAEIISYDQSLTANMLRLVNSGAFGLIRQITSVYEAVRFIGFDETRRLVFAASARSVLGQSKDNWKHFVSTAFVSEGLAYFVDQDPGAAFVAGLLHDVGSAFLQSRYPVHSTFLVENLLSGTDVFSALVAEEAVFGRNHAAVGGLLLKKWNFSTPVIRAVALHHSPEGDEYPFCRVVALANRIAHQYDLPEGDRMYEGLEEMHLGIEVANDMLYLAKLKIDAFLAKITPML